ncbi:uncharacterized membrane protein YgaE (UPF0421/DUF939 family) [Scopulibacillus darangshiensis]|uniref:Uncharacterized membrane protein YgaE (UPF0421/DUF939 family) n=1 Tax=Scopulibacillus darangshiensis TaxID=442528 RepID=A0A4R2NS25_9BACL|nr:aromatic acid exporter family protein [Scopulibacillus darangshiensis]TCP24562.1 uncharacterized membrane protein YgaE (UPF0421/DUF939 family) [Scopulibacillus darangshiensis]
MRLGARSLKTGLAVTLALFVSMFFHLTPLTMSGIAAAVATQPSVHRSIRTMIDNVQGNIIGAIIAMLFVSFIGSNPFIIGLAVIIVIVIQIRLGLHSTLTLTMVTVIVIMAGTPPHGDFTMFAIERVLLVLIGVLSATFVNLVLLPPKYENKLYYTILDQSTELFKWIRLLSHHASEHTKIKDELTIFDKNRLKIDNYYHWYKEERNYLKKHRFAKYRKAVIFRQMITATKKLHDILRALDRNENAFHQLPDSFKKTLQDRLEGLMTYHERVLLKFNGKIRSEHHEEHTKGYCEYKGKITDSFIENYRKYNSEESNWLTFFPLIGSIISYSQNIEHLDQLVEGFQTFHKKENKVNFVEEKPE